MQQTLLVAVLGVAGVLSRFGIDRLLTRPNETFPVSTLAINIVGCFLAGLIYALGDSRLPPVFQTALLVGFCGGFTTFSAYALQTFTMLERGNALVAIIYCSASPVVGVLAAYIPIVLFRKTAG